QGRRGARRRRDLVRLPVADPRPPGPPSRGQAGHLAPLPDWPRGHVQGSGRGAAARGPAALQGRPQGTHHVDLREAGDPALAKEEAGVRSERAQQPREVARAPGEIGVNRRPLTRRYRAGLSPRGEAWTSFNLSLQPLPDGERPPREARG